MRPRKAAARGKDPLTRVREMCDALPEAHEQEAWGTPTFRVRGKIFAMYEHNHHGSGRVALWLKAAPKRLVAGHNQG